MKTSITKRLSAGSIGVAGGLLIGSLATGEAHAAIIAQWTFNDNTASDVSGNGHHGTPQGNFTFVDTPGGRGIEFDGDKNAVAPDIGTGVTVPAHVDLDPTGLDELSVEVWIDIDTDNSSAANNQWIARRSDSKYGIGFKDDGGLRRITYFQNGGSGFETDPFQVDPPGFHHIVYTKNVGEQWALYLNNQLVFGGGGAAGWDNNGPSPIWFGWGGGNALKGVWDEVTIYDVKLTAQEVSDLFNAGPSTNVVNTLPESNEVPVAEVFSTEFASRGTRTYELECTDDLVAPNWADASPTFLEGSGGTMTFSVPLGASGIKAYRLVLMTQ